MPEQRDRGCLSPICPLGPPVDAVVARMGGKKHSRKVANCRRTQQDTVTKRGFLADTSYQDAYVDPRVICAELWIVMLWRNYGLRVKTPKKASITPPATAVGLTTPKESPPATAVGLTTPKETPPDMVRYAWEFRLGCEHARRMTRWLRE